jgi:hypothetical protein
MTWLDWVGDNWFNGLQSLAILSGFVFTCVTLRRDDRSRRGSTLLHLTAHHRDLWAKVLDHPNLRRILQADADLEREPVTYQEALFVRFLILHLNSAFQAMQKGVLDPPEGLREDIRTFLALPIPQAVWEKLKVFQDAAFVRFVEAQRKN